jgi:hypothetical protein
MLPQSPLLTTARAHLPRPATDHPNEIALFPNNRPDEMATVSTGINERPQHPYVPRTEHERPYFPQFKQNPIARAPILSVDGCIHNITNY